MPDAEERKTEEMSALGMDLGELGRSVLDAMPDACVIADRQGRVVYVNPAYARVCYREVGQLVGENIFRDNPDAALAQTLRSGEPTLGKKYRVYGGPVEIVAHAFPLYRAGAMVGAVAFFRELSPALELLADLERVQRTARLLQARLEALGRSGPTLESLVGKSPAMVHVLAVARRAALSNAPVLLQGEIGTGKSTLAQAIHRASRRQREVFLVVPCAQLAADALERSLFGKAENGRFGLFELAGAGSIFFDEVNALPLELQSRLLEILQGGKWQETQNVGPAIIAAATGRLEEIVAEGRFLEDLYHYLRVVKIDLPPLRARPEDVPLLTQHLLQRLCRDLGKSVAGIDQELLAMFRSYTWPGNVRELLNVLERAVMLVEEGGWITPRHVFLPASEGCLGEEMILPLDEVEQIMIARALRKYGTSVSGKKEAARALRISLTTLYNKLRRGGAFTDFTPYRFSRSGKG